MLYVWARAEDLPELFVDPSLLAFFVIRFLQVGYCSFRYCGLTLTLDKRIIYEQAEQSYENPFDLSGTEPSTLFIDPITKKELTGAWLDFYYQDLRDPDRAWTSRKMWVDLRMRDMGREPETAPLKGHRLYKFLRFDISSLKHIYKMLILTQL